MFAYVLCTVIAVLSLAQAAWHWDGIRSAIPLAIGITGGLGLMLSLPRLRAGSMASYASALSLGNALGALAIIPMLVFVRVSEPGFLLGVTQALADGYIAGQFAGLIRFIQHPGDHATRT